MTQVEDGALPFAPPSEWANLSDPVQEALDDAKAIILELLFGVLDRDRSGHAGERDTVAMLRLIMGSEARAEQMLAQESESGHIDARQLRRLLETCVPPKPDDDPETYHSKLVRVILAVLKDFERRAIDACEFVSSAHAREVIKEIQELEKQRAFLALDARKSKQHNGLRRGQAREAREFNRWWTARMAEFNKHARQAIEALRQRHESDLEEYVATQRPLLLAHMRRHHKARETLNAEDVLKRLSQTNEFQEARRYMKHVGELEKRDAAEAEELAEDELSKKLDVLRWQQRLELRAMLHKVDRIRSEHRGQWEEGLARMVHAQRNMISELDARQHRETRKAAAVVRSNLEPAPVPAQQRVAPPHGHLSLLSPRRKGNSHLVHGPLTVRLGVAPPPMQRPSRMLAAAAPRDASLPPPSPMAAYPPRPFTSEHIPSPRCSVMRTPRPLTSSR